MRKSENRLDDWSEVSDEEHSSTVGYFVKGWSNSDGTEVLIWRGAEDLEGVHLETHLHDEAPEDAEYVVEVLKNRELDKEKFATTKPEAVNRALQTIVAEDHQDTKDNADR